MTHPNVPLLCGKYTSVTACEGGNSWGYVGIDIKYALTAGYNVSWRAQGQIWSISGHRHPLIFTKYIYTLTALPPICPSPSFPTLHFKKSWKILHKFNRRNFVTYQSDFKEDFAYHLGYQCNIRCPRTVVNGIANCCWILSIEHTINVLLSRKLKEGIRTLFDHFVTLYHWPPSWHSHVMSKLLHL